MIKINFIAHTYENLQKQLKSEYKKEAEDCIKIYNKLEEISNGSVWSSDWNILVHKTFIGTYPNSKSIHIPTPVGEIFLKGII